MRGVLERETQLGAAVSSLLSEPSAVPGSARVLARNSGSSVGALGADSASGAGAGNVCFARGMVREGDCQESR